MIWGLGLLYLVIAYFHWGLFIAHWYRVYIDTSISMKLTQWEYREISAMALFFGIVPIYWVAAPFVTGFYQCGWMDPFGGRPR